MSVWLARAGLFAAFLAAWQWLPAIPGIRHVVHFLDPFLISSPSRVGAELQALMTGRQNMPLIWPYLAATLEASIVGTVTGVVAGAAAGLFLSNNEYANLVLRPFILAANATPRVAIIPIIVILFGPTLIGTSVTALVVVFFLVFFNAFEGGRAIPREVIQNVRIFGATDWRIMLDVRLPFVLAWTFAALPNAIGLGLVGVVTAEILTGSVGIGRLLIIAMNAVQATETFAIVTILATTGAGLVMGSALLRARLLHWWEQDETK